MSNQQNSPLDSSSDSVIIVVYIVGRLTDCRGQLMQCVELFAVALFDRTVKELCRFVLAL